MSQPDLRQQTIAAFERTYGHRPACFAFAPGRVEILGNHTDYNGGYVMSVALDLGIGVCAARAPENAGDTIELWSDAFPERQSFALKDLQPVTGAWTNYPLGVTREVLLTGTNVGGTRMAFAATLPVGAGISSSAALELSTAEALYHLWGGRPTTPLEEAQLCQRAEVEFVGMPCGLLDQFSSRFGGRDTFLFLDCDTLATDRLSASGSDLGLVVTDSTVKHELVDGQYASLRASCERAAARLGEVLDHPVRFLRDVTSAEFEAHSGELTDEDRPRAEHVIRENERVLAGVEALRAGDFAKIGELMFASHASSRDLFGNSTVELDFLVDRAASLGAVGAKLCGGGFGGATSNLVPANAVDEFAARMTEAYRQRFGIELRTIVTSIGDGARVEAVE